MNIKRDIRFRVYIAFTCICLFGVAILVKAASIQIKEGKELRALAQDMLTRHTMLPAERGNIYTEDGLLLCSSIPRFDIRVDFSVIRKDTFYKHVDGLAASLSRLFGDQSPAGWRKQLVAHYQSQGKYVLLKKNIAYYEYQHLRTFPIFNKGRRRGGLIAESKISRINPYQSLAYRTIGLYRENAQTVGLEASYDSILQGENGSRIDQKATGGVWMPVEGSEIDPLNGRDIVTTLNVGIQEVAQHALKSVLKQYDCQYGTVVIMEVATGKIRALVNLGRQKDGSYFEDFNYAMLPAEPGSTFKLATLLSLLNDRKVHIEDMVDCEGGKKQFANRVMHDSHHGMGKMTIKKAFAQSSNVAMGSLLQKYYGNKPEKHISNLKKLHLDRSLGIGIKGERRPYITEPGSKIWSQTTLPWMGIGYGVMISPLHLCMLYNAVANNGKMMKPYLVSAIREYGTDVKTFSPVVLNEKIAGEEAISQMQASLEEVVLTGTGKSIRSPYYRIAGKTGTAQVADKGIRYSDRVYQGSFAGYFPVDEPQYSIAVVIRTRPRSSSYYGGTLAAPVFRMIADKIFVAGIGSLDIPEDTLEQRKDKRRPLPGKYTVAANYKMLMKAMGKQVYNRETEPASRIVRVDTDSMDRIRFMQESVFRGIVPDVRGMALKDAVYLLENEGMQVLLEGRGLVRQQSVEPGRKIIKGQMIKLQLM